MGEAIWCGNVIISLQFPNFFNTKTNPTSKPNQTQILILTLILFQF